MSFGKNYGDLCNSIKYSQDAVVTRSPHVTFKKNRNARSKPKKLYPFISDKEVNFLLDAEDLFATSFNAIQLVLDGSENLLNYPSSTVLFARLLRQTSSGTKALLAVIQTCKNEIRKWIETEIEVDIREELDEMKAKSTAHADSLLKTQPPRVSYEDDFGYYGYNGDIGNFSKDKISNNNDDNKENEDPLTNQSTNV